MAHRIIWSEAYGFFTSSENITLREVADKYHLNYDSLRQKASKEAWSWKKNQIFKNAYLLMDIRTTEEIAKRNEEQTKIARVLLMKAAEALKSGVLPQSAKDIKQWIETGVEIERLCLGLDKPDNLKKNKANHEWDRYII